MKSYNKKNNKGKFGGYKRKNGESYEGKGFNKKWHHDKFTEKSGTFGQESNQQKNHNPRYKYANKKQKTFKVGKSNGKTKRVFFECMDTVLIIYDNIESMEMNKRIDSFLNFLGIKYNDKTFYLFKIRIFYEMKEKNFKCFNQSNYYKLLEAFEKTYMTPIK
jgi:adenine specific DNA methylase Mod